MGLLKQLSFTSGECELVDSEFFFVPVPAGFHACQDHSIISESRSIVIVPDDYSFYSDAMEAEFALSIQSNTFDIPMPMSPKTKDIYSVSSAEHVIV